MNDTHLNISTWDTKSAMAITLEWVEKPHILQVTYQGKMTLDEIHNNLTEIGNRLMTEGEAPRCLLTVIQPDREIPIGILKLVGHPAFKTFKHVQMSALVGLDHYMIGMMAEKISSMWGTTKVQQYDSQPEALTALQNFVRTELAKR